MYVPENIDMVQVNLFLVQGEGGFGLFDGYRFGIYSDEASHTSKWIPSRPIVPKRCKKILEQVQM